MHYDKVPDKLAESYDYFIVGSDQVWNYNYKCTDLEFLTFAPKNKRIAYSASFGVNSIPNELIDKYRNRLDEMKAISVREQSGADLIEQLINKKVEVLIDPTMLLTQDEWLTFSKEPEQPLKKDYILIYNLYKDPYKILQNVEPFAKKMNLNIIYLPQPQIPEWFSTNPNEFVYLINNAKLIYTDSFHGTVFSILMNTPFIFYDENSMKKEIRDFRLNTLLNMFSFQERRGILSLDFKLPNLFDMDFSHVDNILDAERKKSEFFLRNALNLN